MNRKLTRHYYTPSYPEAFTSRSNLVKRFGKDYDPNEIRDWADSQNNITRFAPAPAKFKRRFMLAHAKNSIFCIDTAFMPKFAKSNKGAIYFTVFVDILSRMLYCFAMKRKRPSDVIKGLEKIFKTVKPTLGVYSDNGGEYGRLFTNFLAKNGIQHWKSRNETKSNLAELKIKQVKQRLYKYLSHTGKKNWTLALPGIVRSINSTYSRNIGCAPIEIQTREDEKRVFLKLYGKKIGIPAPENSMKVGEKYRISHLRENFRKRYLETFTEELFTLNKKINKQDTNLVRLSAHDGEVKGSMYPEEVRLQK